MSLISSLYTGATGLEANSTDLSVIGDNIANANTIGFKESRAAFQDAMSQQMLGAGTASSQMGLGVSLESIQKILTQGAISNTGVATDLAIDGNGFFVVSGAHNGMDGQFYTRAGQFTIDNTGTVVNLEGLHVQGYTANAAGVLGTTPGDLVLGNASWPASPSTTISAVGNLDANATAPVVPFDPLNAAATSNTSTSVTAYDSLGTAHQVDVFFVKTAAGAWDWHALTDGGGLTGGTAGTPTEIATGTLTFDTTGKLTAQTTATSDVQPAQRDQPAAADVQLRRSDRRRRHRPPRCLAVRRLVRLHPDQPGRVRVWVAHPHRDRQERQHQRHLHQRTDAPAGRGGDGAGQGARPDGRDRRKPVLDDAELGSRRRWARPAASGAAASWRAASSSRTSTWPTSS